MKNEKYRIREICGDWALDIPFPGSAVTIFFNSRANAELVKQILIHEDAHPGEAVPFKPSHFPDLTKMAPLTLEQLREMDGEPVWIVEAPHWGHWELSEDAEDYIIDRHEEFYGLKYNDPEGKHGLHKLGWLAYAYPPAHIDREAWKSCKLCEKYKVFQFNAWEKPEMSLGNIDCMGTSLFCPHCGRPLTDEAVEMVMERLEEIHHE